MEEDIKTILKQQDIIITQQQEIISSMRRIDEMVERLQFDTQRHHNKTDSRMELIERSTKQIDEQLALLNIKRNDELTELKPTLERLQVLEELMRLNIVNQMMTSVENSIESNSR